ncbi:MAG: CxxxxCH/CxxCH domain-containing protein, partial [Deltaproteobacteria bacterium]|nr:CxxxxCH/CxxCH domain-containing protein [Deltaproteobacteria bacterium]
MIDMRFEARNGAESFDDGASQANNICVACHNNGTRPGSGSAMLNIDGNHAENGDYTGNEQSRDCSGCHSHDYDGSMATVDGFMPLQCNGCHSFPALSGTTPANQYRLSAVHDPHVGRPSNEAAVNNKGYSCSTCHTGADHNSSTSPGGTVANGSEWAAKVTPNLNTRVQVRYDLTWNPGTSPNPGSTSADNTNYDDGANVCSNLYCHGAALGAQGTATAPAWSGTLACNACHGDTSTVLTSRSHQAHLTTTTGAGAACGDCHTPYDFSAAGSHLNGSVTFVGAASGYTGNTADHVPGTGLGSCGTNRCHNDGKGAAPVAASYTWGTAINGANSCTECHNATTTIATDSHDEHLTTSTGVAAVCADCHAAATLATHADGTVDLASKAANYPTGSRPVVTTSFGGCGTNACHNNGKNAAPLAASYTWGTAINGANSCTECHVATTLLATDSHDEHLTTSTGAAAVCADCHAAATLATHGDGTVDLLGKAAGYPAGSRPVVTASFGGCGTNLCHNNGQNGAPATNPYTWGVAINGANSCTECHVATSAIATGSHPAHLTTTTGAGAVCADCHAAATLTTHGNGTIDLLGAAANYPAANRVVVVSSVGGCSTNRCHNDGKNAPPAQPGYLWGTAINGPNSCTECHVSTTALATDSHDEHLTAAALFGIAGVGCGSCHAAATLATHADGTIDLLGAAANYPAGNRVVSVASVGSCGTNFCHNAGDGVSAPVTGTYNWGTVLGNCTECHNSTTATLATTSHAPHFNGTWGGRVTSCSTCHSAATVSA